MAQVPSTRWTPRRVLSMVRELTDTIDQRKVLTDQGRFFYDAAISEIVTLLNNSADPAYFKTVAFSLATDTRHYRDSSHLYLPDGFYNFSMTVNGSTLLITPSTYIPEVGTLLVITAHNMTFNPTASVYSCTAIVNSKTLTTCTATILAGNAIASGSNYAHSMVAVGSSDATLDISSFTHPVDRIISVYDTVNGQCKEISLNEFRSLQRPDMQNNSYSRDIVWTQVGNTLMFKNGANVTAGAKYLDYQRQPSYPVNYDDSEYVDLADKWIPLLIKRIYVYVILQVENDVPQTLMNEINTFYPIVSATVGAELENRKKRPTQSEQSR
jgi:hypothetical protein